MKIVATKAIQSSFLSCERDLDKIIHLLLVDNKPYSDQLKRLLIVTNNDCLNTAKYQTDIDAFTDADLIKDGYVRKRPKIAIDETVKSYLIITFTNFIPNASNPAFRDCNISIDILCHADCWDLDDMSSRPVKIMGYIDGILNHAKLDGIGELQFEGADILLLSDELMGYSMTYSATHNSLPSEGDDTSITVVPVT